MELGCFTSPLCWCVLFVEQVARAISVCFFYSVVTPLRKDQSSEMSPGLYRGANMWHIWSGLKSWNLSMSCRDACWYISSLDFSEIWRVVQRVEQGLEPTGNLVCSSPPQVLFLLFTSSASLFNLYTGKSNKAAEFTESLPLNRNSEGGSGLTYFTYSETFQHRN